MKKKLESDSPLRAATCSPSSTPEMDAAAYEATTRTVGKWIVPIAKARKMEADRDHWRNEHDRILREFQHRLTVLATSAIEATNYPENDPALATRGLESAPENHAGDGQPSGLPAAHGSASSESPTD